MRAFLSHASVDKEGYVRIVASRLSDEDIVFDEMTFEAGEKTLSEIIRGLDDSSLFVLFISDGSLNSPWVQEEIKQAELRLASGDLKAIYPIIIDRQVTFTDPRIPKWLRDNYNLKLVPRPVVAARRIQQKLRQISWSRHPALRERQTLFVGRNANVEAFERRFDDFSRTKPVVSIVGGHPSIGRRTLIRNALKKLSLSSIDGELPVIYLDRHASIEDLILRLLDLGVSETTFSSLDLVDKSLEEKVAIAKQLLRELLPLRERVIVVDEGSLVDYKRELPEWFQSIVKDEALQGHPVLFVAARWELNPACARKFDSDVYSTKINELDDSERRRLFGRLLEIEGISLSEKDFETFADLLHGFPDEVYFAVDLISRFGAAGAVSRSHEIVEFNAEKAATLLRKFDGDDLAQKIVRLLAQSEIFSIQFLSGIFPENKLADVLSDLVSEHVCEFIGVEGEFVRLIDTVRDYVKRNNLRLEDDVREAVRAAVARDVEDAKWDHYDSSRIAFVVRQALASGSQLEPKFLIPSHVLRSMRDLYHGRGDQRRVVKLADELLKKEKNLEPQLAQDVRYYLCLALARLRDKRLLEEVQHVKGNEHNFILGHYYRLTGRHKDALDRLWKVVDAPFVEARAKREIVEVLLQTEQYDEARQLASRSYQGNRTNQFHIQAYFRALVLGSNPEKHRAELFRLCEELDAVASEQSRQMAMIGRAQIVARCDHDKRALDLIEDAINSFPDVVYPVLAKFDIAASFRHEAGMRDALDRLERFARDGRGVSPRTLALQRAYLMAFKGDLPGALQSIEDLISDYPDEAREKLREKVAAVASAT